MADFGGQPKICLKRDVVTYGGNITNVIDVGDYGGWQKLHPAIPPWQKVHNIGCMIAKEINAFGFFYTSVFIN